VDELFSKKGILQIEIVTLGLVTTNVRKPTFTVITNGALPQFLEFELTENLDSVDRNSSNFNLPKLIAIGDLNYQLSSRIISSTAQGKLKLTQELIFALC
jgi:hypothetical protein